MPKDIPAAAPEPQETQRKPANSAGFFVYRGQCFAPVRFDRLPGREFTPNVPVALDAVERDIARGIAALEQCDEKGTAASAPVPDKEGE